MPLISFVSVSILPSISNLHTSTLQCMNPSWLDHERCHPSVWLMTVLQEMPMYRIGTLTPYFQIASVSDHFSRDTDTWHGNNKANPDLITIQNNAQFFLYSKCYCLFVFQIILRSYSYDFFSCWDKKIFWQKKFNGDRVYFVLQFKGALYPDLDKGAGFKAVVILYP